MRGSQPAVLGELHHLRDAQSWAKSRLRAGPSSTQGPVGHETIRGSSECRRRNGSPSGQRRKRDLKIKAVPDRKRKAANVVRYRSVLILL